MAAPFANVGSATAPSGGSSNYAPSIDARYMVTFDVQDRSGMTSSTGKSIFPIRAALSERFNLEFSSTWEPAFAKYNLNAGGAVSAATGGRVSADLVNDAMSATGKSSRNKASTAQVWQDTSPLTLNLELIFRAQTNSVTDVKEKHLALLKMTAPTQMNGGLMLQAPGPNMLDQAGDGGRKISVRIGNYLYLDNVVIKSVSSDINCLFDSSGVPQSMTISVGLESFYSCFTTQDMDKMFGY